MTYDIESRTLAAQDTAVIRGSMPAAQLPAWIAGVYEEVYRYLTNLGIRTSGPPFARYTFDGGLLQVEAGFPVLQPVAGRGRVVASRLPGGPAAVTTHEGRYEDLALACQAVADWLKERDLEAAGPHWEVYYTNPAAQPDPATWSTDLVMPYRAG
ncbi:GyrI-like domain-containing protein [Actinoplanes solisilvae]|uniref:GyrI-like domain-containing protein n=1 Tax=Actinoplanes solisilvae TaxID=2486853 RepID=UPI000FD94939|nr:GyrI-like domain-containing protein [Actinoplanes solisilvae]